MKADDAERLKELERENALLKRIDADKEPQNVALNVEEFSLAEARVVSATGTRATTGGDHTLRWRCAPRPRAPAGWPIPRPVPDPCRAVCERPHRARGENRERCL
jgi:hypothetical protein